MQPLWRTVWRALNKLKMELLFDPAIPLLSEKAISDGNSAASDSGSAGKSGSTALASGHIGFSAFW